MDLAATVFSTGWASGVNAYATVLLLCLLGRAGVGEVPDQLTEDPVLVLVAVMYAIEFVTDKIPYLDNVWDVAHTVVRPAVAGGVGAVFGVDADVSGLDEALAAGGSATTALASHGVKAGLRLGINASPEPLSNFVTSLVEDGLVAVVTVLAIQEPWLAAGIAVLLLAGGMALVFVLATRIRRTWAQLRRRGLGGV